MSVRAVDWALNAPIRDPYAKLVLVAFADHADAETNQCWPSISYIADRLGFAESTIYKSVAFLVEKGFIEREQRRSANGMRSALTTLQIAPPSVLRRVPPSACTEGVPPPVRSYINEPSIEPSKNLTDSHSAPSGRMGSHSESHSHIGNQTPIDGGFASHDGVVTLTPRECEQWEDDCPHIENIWDVARHLYDWAAKNVEPQRRKAAILSALKNKNDRAIKKQREAAPLMPDGVMTYSQLRGIK